MENFECRNCGGPLLLSDALNGVVACKYCGSKFTVPKRETSPAALHFLRMGEHELDTADFDKAYESFKKAAECDESEPEAYWGMALAEFKVRYIKDVRNNPNRLQPICHAFIDKDFTSNKNYLAAISAATSDQREEYKKKAQEIDYIRSEFFKLKQSGLHYDCFICVKVSKTEGEQENESGKNWTDDAYDADAIYDLLKGEGFSPFFSEREIRGRTGVDYEAMILYALYTSETMLVVCRNEEYLQTPWVKNEYTRFKELLNDKKKENDSLTIVYYKTPIERLPISGSGAIQGIDYANLREANFKIVKFVEAHTPLARAKKEAEKRRREEKDEQLSRELDNLKKQVATATRQVASATETIESLSERASQEMEFGRFGNAKPLYDRILRADPRNAEAWFGLFLVDYQCQSERQLLNGLTYETAGEIDGNQNYQMALKFGAESSNARISNFKYLLTERVNEVAAQKKKRDDEAEQQKKKFKQNKIILSAVAVAGLVISYIVMITTQGGIGYTGNNGFIGIIAFVATVGGLVGMLVYLVRSLKKLWKCEKIDKKIISMIVVNVFLPFIWNGAIMILSSLG
ncbi:MAG: toll/interleukin-1 receptor domain-containing protein [Roseburia sp.]|nr:toll/interleukin-1 receptor domain-containing protein [Roseburia sp.]